MIIYLLLCVISILAGRGILRLIGVRIDPRRSVYLASPMVLIFWTLFLGLGILNGFAVKNLYLAGWSLTLLMAVGGVWREDFGFLRKEWPSLVAVVLLPMCLMFTFFWGGITTYLGGSFRPDGWSYIAYAEYLREYPKGIEGGLAPLYQYAAHLAGSRFIASALLAFFSPLAGSGGSAQAASGYFLAWTVFIFSSACMFLAAVKELGKGWQLCYVSLCVFSGWMINLLAANNYDNTLALSFLPAFAGVVHLIDPRDRRWGIALAGLASATLYCYPEMSPLVLGGACLFLLQRVLAGTNAIREWFSLLLCVAILTAILVLPFFKDLVAFMMNQLSMAMGNVGTRPGEGFFNELLNPQYRLIGFWGFGGVDPFAVSKFGKAWQYGCTLLAIVLSVMAAFGVFELFKRKEWALATTIAILFVGSLRMIFHWAYSYGAYKFILLNWWGMSLAVLLAAGALISRLRVSKYRWGAKIAFTTVFLLFLFITGVRLVSVDTAIAQQSILPFKQVEKIKNIVGDGPVSVAIDDDSANAWAVYFLREVPIYLAEYRHYMAQPHVVPLMQRARPIDLSTVHYILTDGKKTSLLLSGRPYSLSWSSGPFYLWKMSGSNETSILESTLRGFGSIDLVNLSETAGLDGQVDAVFALEVKRSGRIQSLELRNTDGLHSVWDTVPGNGHVLLGVAEADRPGVLVNRPDGSVEIGVEGSHSLLLYAADNSSIRGGQTHYQLSLTFADGQMGSIPVRNNSTNLAHQD